MKILLWPGGFRH